MGNVSTSLFSNVNYYEQIDKEIRERELQKINNEKEKLQILIETYNNYKVVDICYPKPDNKTFLTTIMMYTSRNDYVKLKELLKNNEINLNQEVQYLGEFYYPLNYACTVLNFRIVKLLVENGANINIKPIHPLTIIYNKYQDQNYKYYRQEIFELAKYFIENGAEIPTGYVF